MVCLLAFVSAHELQDAADYKQHILHLLCICLIGVSHGAQLIDRHAAVHPRSATIGGRRAGKALHAQMGPAARWPRPPRRRTWTPTTLAPALTPRQPPAAPSWLPPGASRAGGARWRWAWRSATTQRTRSSRSHGTTRACARRWRAAAAVVQAAWRGARVRLNMRPGRLRRPARSRRTRAPCHAAWATAAAARQRLAHARAAPGRLDVGGRCRRRASAYRARAPRQAPGCWQQPHRGAAPGPAPARATGS